MPAWMFTTYLGELEVGGPRVSLTPPAGSKSQPEDQGEVDEEGRHLCEHIKKLYKENYLSELLHTHGMEDAISLVSSFSPSYLSMNSTHAPPH